MTRATAFVAGAAGCILVAAAGCTEPAPERSPWADVQTPAQRARHAGVDPRDQYALLDAVVAAKGSQLHADPAALARVRGDWIDHRVRWSVGLQPALCRSVGDCVVLPFDHSTRAAPIDQGWLPRLDLDTRARTALRQRCADHQRCVITLEATLSQFELSTELPTSVTLSDVQLLESRNASADESWTVSRRRKRLTDRIVAARAQASRQRSAGG